jgi:ribosomal protein S18 acetylase RimI-like enzyme
LRFGRKIASIHDVSVEESSRGKGFGRQILALAENHAKRAGAGKIRLHVFAENTVARSLYKSAEFNETNVDMCKALT